MPSWLWVIILLIAVAAIVVGLMWYVGVFAALGDWRPQGQDRHGPGSLPASPPPGAPPPRELRAPSPTAVRPPALAGPPPRDASNAASEAGSRPGGPLPAPSPGGRSIPPAAPAGKSNASREPAVRKPASKPPPAQALLSTSAKSREDGG